MTKKTPTQWELIHKLEELLEQRPVNLKTQTLIVNFLEKLFQQNLIDKHIVHWLCESSNDRSIVVKRWESLHQFAKDNEEKINEAEME